MNTKRHVRKTLALTLVIAMVVTLCPMFTLTAEAATRLNTGKYFENPPVNTNYWSEGKIKHIKTQDEFRENFIFYRSSGEIPPYVATEFSTIVIEHEDLDKGFSQDGGNIHVGTGSGTTNLRLILNSELNITPTNHTSHFYQSVFSTLIIEEKGHLIIGRGGTYNSLREAQGQEIGYRPDQYGVRYNAITVKKGGKLTIDGGTFNLAEAHPDAIVIEEGGIVEFKSGSFSVNSGSTIEIAKGGTLIVNGRIEGSGRIINEGEVHFGPGGSLSGITFETGDGLGAPPMINPVNTDFTRVKYDRDDPDNEEELTFTTSGGTATAWEIVHNYNGAFLNPPDDMLVPKETIGDDGAIKLLPTPDHIGRNTPYRVTATNDFGLSIRDVVFTVYSDTTVMPQENKVFHNPTSGHPAGVAEFTLIAPGINGFSGSYPEFTPGNKSTTITDSGGTKTANVTVLDPVQILGATGEWKLELAVNSATAPGTYTIDKLWLNSDDDVSFDLVIDEARTITITQTKPAEAGVITHYGYAQMVEFDLVTQPGAFARFSIPGPQNIIYVSSLALPSNGIEWGVTSNNDIFDPDTGLGKMTLSVRSSVNAGTHEGISIKFTTRVTTADGTQDIEVTSEPFTLELDRQQVNHIANLEDGEDRITTTYKGGVSTLGVDYDFYLETASGGLNLFKLDEKTISSPRPRKYTIIEDPRLTTGTGTIEVEGPVSRLRVTEVGDFLIQVDTEAYSTYAAGTAQVLLTVLPKTITPGVTAGIAGEMVYNGTDDEVPITLTLTGVGDTDVNYVTAPAGLMGTMIDRHVGTGKDVTVDLSGVTLIGGTSGDRSKNYTIAAGTNNFEYTTTVDVTPAAIAYNGTIRALKVHDGNNIFSVEKHFIFPDPLPNPPFTLLDDEDVITLVSTGVAGTLPSSAVGASGTLTLNPGFTLSDTHSGNYTLTQPEVTARISGGFITFTGTVSAGKVYDGTTAFTADDITISNAESFVNSAGQAVSGVTLDIKADAAGTVPSKNVGTTWPFTVTSELFELTGAAAGDYDLDPQNLPTIATATITQRPVTFDGEVGASKTYDGNNIFSNAQITITNAAIFAARNANSGVIDDDDGDVRLSKGSLTGTTASANVSASGEFTPSGNFTLEGDAAGNYRLSAQPPVTVTITQKPLTITGVTAVNRAYDGTNTVDIIGGALAGVIAGDAVTPVVPSTGTVGDPGVGTGKDVSIGTIGLTGTSAGNYTLTQPTDAITVNITAATISGVVSITAGTTPGEKIEEGDTLTADVDGILPAAARSGSQLSYEWFNGTTPIGTDSTYIVTEDNETNSAVIVVTVTGTGGNVIGSVSSIPVVVGKIPIYGSVTIDQSEGLKLGDTLTLVDSGVEPSSTAKYDIIWRRDGAAIADEIGTEYIIANDDLGKKISVEVVGADEYTGTLIASVDIPTIPPYAPGGFTATPGNGQVTLSWSLPFHGGRTITHYQVSSDNGGTWISAGSDTGHTFTGLINGTLYTFKVRAVTAEGTGAEETATATPTPGTTPPPADSGSGGGEQRTPPPTDSERAIDEISNANDNDTVRIVLGENTLLEREVFESIAGKDITVVVELPNGLRWVIHGRDVPPDGLRSIDMGVSLGGQTIPVNIINLITGEISVIQIVLMHNGPFGFTMYLQVPLGEDNAGYWANLYYYNEEAETSEFRSASLIEEDGFVLLPFSGASAYAIYIDTLSHAPQFFGDVFETSWFYSYVRFVFERSLMTGTSTAPMLFSPQVNVTRAMAVSVLYNMEGRPDVSGYPNPFTDLHAGSWYYDAVMWAAANGIVGGFEDGTFRPGDNITRAHLAIILNNYAEIKGFALPVLTEYHGFADDADIRDYAREAVERFFRAGIINGKPGNVFDPRGEATRAELAAMLTRFLGAVGQE